MKKMLHTLYINDPKIRLRLEGRNLCAENQESGNVDKIPMHMLENVISYSYLGATPALMEACAEAGIGLHFLNRSGKLRYQVVGETHGNVLLRRQQFRISEEESLSLPLAKDLIHQKIQDQRLMLRRYRNNHPEKETACLKELEDALQEKEKIALWVKTQKGLLGVEGSAARLYFSGFGDMICAPEKAFVFSGRNRRPPKDCTNALLSYVYTLLERDCVQALECVGLDPYMGILHQERPGKPALALDLMECMRTNVADRFTMNLINRRRIKANMFENHGNGVYLHEKGRKLVLEAWNQMREEECDLPELEESIPMGLLPYVQATQLARKIRGEEENWPLTWR